MSDNMDNLSNSLNKMNVNAPSFVPNVNAPVFVPSFGSPTVEMASEPVSESKPSPPAVSPVEEKPEASAAAASVPMDDASPSTDGVVDDWENEGDIDIDDVEDEEDMNEDDDDESLSTKRKEKKKSGRRGRSKVSESHDAGPKKDHVNIVFIGHVDAGKSTIGGQILRLTGMVDKRTLEKYEREAKEKNRESWYLSWALDTNQEERDKGKTVEVGRAFFMTETKHFTLLDAPGHKGFVPNMIGGACQADLAVLVISARKGEFETGFERGGQTREHAMLAKTAGVKHLIVLINKMDDPTVLWDESRYIECRDKLLPYLKKCGFNPKNEVFFMPCSGYTGDFLLDIPDESLCSWYRGPSFLKYIDELPSPARASDGPFRMPVVDKYRDMGTVVLGKVESGSVRRGETLSMMPNRRPVEVLQLWNDDEEVTQVLAGENVKIKLKGIEEEEVTSGFVLCDPNNLCSVAKVFDAQVAILEHKSIICKGYSAVLHLHASIEEVSVRMIALIDKKTGEKVKDQIAIMRLECIGGAVCMEPFAAFPQMGRFTLRDEGKTVAIGKVLKVVE